jgi:hypothetical protein
LKLSIATRSVSSGKLARVRVCETYKIAAVVGEAVGSPTEEGLTEGTRDGVKVRKVGKAVGRIG